MSNVPRSALTERGFVAPEELDVLSGVIADINEAFGGDLNPALNTPQGQLAQSITAIVGDKNDAFLALANGVDPQFASGRMQDAIGRIYFLTRKPSTPTVVTVRCTGLAGTNIPVGARIADASGNRYACVSGGAITSSGTLDAVFEAEVHGPVACPIGAITTIYRAIPGWDSVTNPSAGRPGTNVETRSEFEQRRRASVAANANGSLSSVVGSVLSVDGVVDALGLQNTMSAWKSVVAQVYISGAQLTIYTNHINLPYMEGHIVVGPGIVEGTVITGVAGWYSDRSVYTVSAPQTVNGVTAIIAQGGVELAPHSIYVSVYGGTDQEVAEAIWRKKDPGCNMNGTTAVEVEDNSNGYQYPVPRYTVRFQRPTPTPIRFAVTMQRSTLAPSNAADLIRAAIIKRFNGDSGSQRARIGAAIFASSFYGAIESCGEWATVIDVLVGITQPSLRLVATRINQVPTLDASNIAVTFL